MWEPGPWTSRAVCAREVSSEPPPLCQWGFGTRVFLVSSYWALAPPHHCSLIQVSSCLRSLTFLSSGLQNESRAVQTFWALRTPHPFSAFSLQLPTITRDLQEDARADELGHPLPAAPHCIRGDILCQRLCLWDDSPAHLPQPRPPGFGRQVLRSEAWNENFKVRIWQCCASVHAINL